MSETRTCGGCAHYRSAEPAGCGVALPMWLHWTDGNRLVSPDHGGATCDAWTARAEAATADFDPPDAREYTVGDAIGLRREPPAPGRKDDAGKDRWDLLPLGPITELVKVLTFGASKYSPNSWRGVEPDRYYAAAMRHLVAWRGGEERDPESGLPHLAHALCSLVFVMAIEAEKER